MCYASGLSLLLLIVIVLSCLVLAAAVKGHSSAASSSIAARQFIRVVWCMCMYRLHKYACQMSISQSFIHIHSLLIHLSYTIYHIVKGTSVFLA